MPCQRNSSRRTAQAKAVVVCDLGRMAYGPCLDLQRQAHAEVVAGGPERILLVEHEPVVTVTRRAAAGHVLLSREALAARGIELCETDRGGDVTYHGPGQLVVYPIVRLAELDLNVGGYVRLLEEAVVAAAGCWGIKAERDAKARGVWVGQEKLCAVGVRVSRNVSLHGLALNVTTRLEDFEVIIPCGLRDRGVTSLQRLLGGKCPTMERVKQVVVQALRGMLGTAAASVGQAGQTGAGKVGDGH